MNHEMSSFFLFHITTKCIQKFLWFLQFIIHKFKNMINMVLQLFLALFLSYTQAIRSWIMKRVPTSWFMNHEKSSFFLLHKTTNRIHEFVIILTIIVKTFAILTPYLIFFAIILGPFPCNYTWYYRMKSRDKQQYIRKVSSYK